MKIVNEFIVWFLRGKGYTIGWVHKFPTRPIDVFTLLAEKYWPSPTDSPVMVQIGANDGVNDDPLIKVRKSTWKGLLVEPNPDAVAKLKVTYKDYPLFSVCPLAVTKAETTVRLYLGENSLYASTNKEFCQLKEKSEIYAIDVPGKPLATILAANKIDRIDIFITDTEGCDHGVMMQLLDIPWARPKLLQFEHALMTKEEFNEVCARLVEAGYRLVHVDRDTVAELAEARN